MRIAVLALLLNLPSVAIAALSGIAASPQDIFSPSPLLSTNELVLEEWQVISQTEVGDGRDEITIAPMVSNTNIGQFTYANFTLTTVPSGVEIVDGVVEVGVETGSDIVLEPAGSVEATNGIVLRAAPNVFANRAQFLQSLMSEPYRFTAAAKELPVVAEGVFKVERFNRSPEPPQGSTYEYTIPNASVTADPLAPNFQAEIERIEETAEAWMNNVRTQANGQPIVEFICVSDPNLRAPNSPVTFLPPAEWFPNDATLGSHYRRSEELPNGRVFIRYYFKITFNLTDPGPIFVDPRAFAKTGTFVGGYGTPDPPNAPADMLGDTQDDPLSLGTGDLGVMEPKYWSVRRKEIVDDVYFSGQMGMSGVTGKLLLRLRDGQDPYFESSLTTTYGAAFRVWSKKDFELEERTYQPSPDEPIPLASFPIGPIECRLTMSPFLQLGIGGELHGSAVAGWREQMTSTLSFVVKEGESTIDLSHERAPRHRTGPFWNAETNGSFRAFGRASLSLDLTFSGMAGFELDANADAVAKFTVDSTQTPWWKLETGRSADLTFSGNVLGFDLFEKTKELGENLEPTDNAAAPPKPDGKPNASESHWAQVLTWTDYTVLREADVAPLSNGGLLIGAAHSVLDNVLIELDPDGQEVRTKFIRGLIRPITSVHPLSDGGLIYLAGDVVVRLDANWNTAWMKKLTPPGGTIVRINALDVGNESGRVVIYVAATASFGFPQSRAIVMKLDAAGALQWANTYEASGAESLTSLKVMPSGGCVAAGQSDALWNDTRDPGLSGAFPDDVQNAYLIRINSDGSSPWSQAATPDRFVALAVHPDGRIGAGSENHSVPDPRRGPALYVFADDGTFLWASSYALDVIEEGLEKGDTVVDGVVDVAAAQGGGFMLACKTGKFPEVGSASYVMSIDGSGSPDWAVMYDWEECPREFPVRLIDRGDSYFLLSALDGAQVNGGPAIDCLFMTCIPDSGLLDLFPTNRMEALDYYRPVVDNISGRGVLGAYVTGLPMAHDVTIAPVAGLSAGDFRANLSTPDRDLDFINLTDAQPFPEAPDFDLKPGVPGRLSLSWPRQSGYAVFESCDLIDWVRVSDQPARIGDFNVLDVPVDPAKNTKFFRLEQVAPSN